MFKERSEGVIFFLLNILVYRKRNALADKQVCKRYSRVVVSVKNGGGVMLFGKGE